VPDGQAINRFPENRLEIGGAPAAKRFSRPRFHEKWLRVGMEYESICFAFR
jgi:hypothetical protein